MPLVSKAQQRWAYANQNTSGSTGAAAREFIAATPKAAFKKLPEHVKAGKPAHKPKLAPFSLAPAKIHSGPYMSTPTPVNPDEENG